MDNPENPVHAELEKLPKETLIELIKMYSRNWHTCDGLWFSGVEERYGVDKALEIDINMWDAAETLLPPLENHPKPAILVIAKRYCYSGIMAEVPVLNY